MSIRRRCWIPLAALEQGCFVSHVVALVVPSTLPQSSSLHLQQRLPVSSSHARGDKDQRRQLGR